MIEGESAGGQNVNIAETNYEDKMLLLITIIEELWSTILQENCSHDRRIL